MSWQPTIGTLSDEDLYLAKITIAALGYDDVVAHIDALTAQLERARGIAVTLEQELAALRHQSDRLIEELHTENDALAWRRLYWECWAGEQEQLKEAAESAIRRVYAAYPQRYVMPMAEPTEAQIAEMQSGAGTWPMRQYATVELPDELLLGDADMHRIGAHIAGSVDVDGQVADAGMGDE